MGEWWDSSTRLSLRIECKWAVSFTSRPLYPPPPLYALSRRLLGCIALGPDALMKRKLFLPQPRIEPQFLCPPAHRRGYTDDWYHGCYLKFVTTFCNTWIAVLQHCWRVHLLNGCKVAEVMQYVELALPLAIRGLLCLTIPAVSFELTWWATFNLIYAFVDLGIRLPPPRTILLFQNRKGFSAQNRFGKRLGTSKILRLGCSAGNFLWLPSNKWPSTATHLLSPVTAATKLREAESLLRSYNLFQNITATYHEIETDVRQCGEACSNLIWLYGDSIYFFWYFL
jgi:hypothetical protein